MDENELISRVAQKISDLTNDNQVGRIIPNLPCVVKMLLREKPDVDAMRKVLASSWRNTIVQNIPISCWEDGTFGDRGSIQNQITDDLHQVMMMNNSFRCFTDAILFDVVETGIVDDANFWQHIKDVGEYEYCRRGISIRKILVLLHNHDDPLDDGSLVSKIISDLDISEIRGYMSVMILSDSLANGAELNKEERQQTRLSALMKLLSYNRAENPNFNDLFFGAGEYRNALLTIYESQLSKNYYEIASTTIYKILEQVIRKNSNGIIQDDLGKIFLDDVHNRLRLTSDIFREFQRRNSLPQADKIKSIASFQKPTSRDVIGDLRFLNLAIKKNVMICLDSYFTSHWNEIQEKLLQALFQYYDYGDFADTEKHQRIQHFFHIIVNKQLSDFEKLSQENVEKCFLEYLDKMIAKRYLLLLGTVNNAVEKKSILERMTNKVLEKCVDESIRRYYSNLCCKNEEIQKGIVRLRKYFWLYPEDNIFQLIESNYELEEFLHRESVFSMGLAEEMQRRLMDVSNGCGDVNRTICDEFFTQPKKAYFPYNPIIDLHEPQEILILPDDESLRCIISQRINRGNMQIDNWNVQDICGRISVAVVERRL